MVTRTNFLTTKGTLIRSILYSSKRRFDFYGDTYVVLMVSMAVAFITLATVLPVFIKYFDPYHIIIRILSPFTVSVPAILPACMSMGILFAFGRLYLWDIYCTSPPKINAAGRVSTMVFDKTGTLTYSGLNIVSMKIINGDRFEKSIKDPQDAIEQNDTWRNPNQYESEETFLKFVECMATCHSCTYVEEKLIGDPLELEMFKYSKWVMDEGKSMGSDSEDNFTTLFYPKKLSQTIREKGNKGQAVYKLSLIRKYDFSPELQRMSVLCKNHLDNTTVCYIKGSPEMIESL